MPTEKIYVVGASGHGAVILDALLSSGVSVNDIEVRDDDYKLFGRYMLDWQVQCPAHDLSLNGVKYHIAIGNANVRKHVYQKFNSGNARSVAVVHPRSSISRYSEINEGVFVAANAIVAARTQIGICSIVNHGAIVDHDCVIGDFSHIAPNSTLGGGVRIGDGALIGAGAVVLPGISVGNGAIIGAGAVVNRNVGDGEKMVGVPARCINRK